MKIFVTGAAGFIGSNFVRRILENSDNEITVFDLLTYAGSMSTIEDLKKNSRFHFVHGDICDEALVADAMLGHSAVVHFAAESHVDRSIYEPDVFIKTNCYGTNVLCKVAQKLGVERFIHISTDEVYGSVLEGSSIETDTLAPRSPYSASKASSDLIALSYYTTYHLPITIVRSTNNYGPFQFPEKIIPLFTTNLLDNIKVPLYGDGKNIRDWCHVSDNCSAIETVLEAGQTGEIYNVGAGNEINNVHLTQMLLDLTNKDESMIKFVDDRAGHDRRYSVNTEKIRALGWNPNVSLEDGLSNTVKWYADNRSWWEKFKTSS